MEMAIKMAINRQVTKKLIRNFRNLTHGKVKTEKSIAKVVFIALLYYLCGYSQYASLTHHDDDDDDDDNEDDDDELFFWYG